MVMSMDAQDLSSEQITFLKAFSRALNRDMHVLSQHPEFLRQQLYNQLQWETEVDNQAITSQLVWLKTLYEIGLRICSFLIGSSARAILPSLKKPI